MCEIVGLPVQQFFSPDRFQSVIDGDLCEQFNSLDPARKRGVAEELDRTPNEASYMYTHPLTTMLNFTTADTQVVSLLEIYILVVK